ncbi:MAG: RidA family protein [Bacteroidota bacterium]
MSLSLLYKSSLYIGIFLLISTNLRSQEPPSPIFHPPENPARATAPFSEAVQVGNLFFLSGQIGMDRSAGKLAPGGIQGETKQAILNIQKVLQYHNLNLDNVVKCTVILSDIADFKAFNEVYVQYFPKKPARTTFAAAGLAVGAKIEIAVVAAQSP